MNVISKRAYKGFGLIEVMVTLVILALGLLALASLESRLMFSSGDNKARLEAKALVETMIEQFRDSIEVGDIADTGDGNTGYLDRADLTAGTYSDSVSGTNANFNRAWTIADITAFGASTIPPRKRVSVQVTWGGASSEETVYAVSEIAWIDPAKSLLVAEISSGSGTSAVPSPRQNASEDVASEDVFDVPDSLITSGTAGTDTTLTIGSITDITGALTATNVIVTQVAPNSHYYATDNTTWFFVEPGVIAVFLCDGTTCKYIQDHFGGNILRIAGKVSSMSGELLGDITVAWSSSDVNACYQDATSTTTTVDRAGHNQNSTTLHTMSYECVYAGNCDAIAEADRDGIASVAVTTDPNYPGNGCSTNVTHAQILSRNVGPGGEFGEVGLLGVDDSGGDRENLCFLEDTSDPSLSQNVLLNGASSGEQYDEDYIFPVTKRSYVSRRRNSDDTETSEGINQSFDNHNFLLVDRATGGSTSESCHDIVAANTSNANFTLAPRDIVRTLSSTNTVASEVVYAGGNGPAITLSGSATAATDLNLYISSSQAGNSESGSCYVKSDGSAYACVVPSDTTTVEVEGGSATYPSAATAYATCTRGVSTVAPTLSAACVWPTATDFVP